MVRELAPELAEIAKNDLNENPKQLKSDIEQLKQWISQQPHLKARTDDQWLVALLRGCKFSMERVKKKLDLYYTLRTTASDLTLRMKPSEDAFIQFFRKGSCLVLPKSKSLHPRVVLIRAGAIDPAADHVADVMCVLYYLVQILVIDDDIASVLGTKIVVDYEGVSMSHVTQANPSMLKKMVSLCQDSMPLRLKGSHHFHMPVGIEVMFTVISQFLNAKAKERLKTHKNADELLEVLPHDIIPAEYGGDGGTLSEITEFWVGRFNEYRNWMKEEEKFGTDESKRSKDKSGDELNGGSFRQLQID